MCCISLLGSRVSWARSQENFVAGVRDLVRNFGFSVRYCGFRSFGEIQTLLLRVLCQVPLPPVDHDFGHVLAALHQSCFRFHVGEPCLVLILAD